MLCFFFYSFRLCFLWELTSTVLQLWRWAGLYLGKYNVQFYVSLSGYLMKMGHCWSLQNAACMSHTCMTLVVAYSISHLSLWLSSSIGVSNAKVLGSIPVRIKLFFLCLTLVTRQTTAYLQNLCEVWMLNITNMVQNNFKFIWCLKSPKGLELANLHSPIRTGPKRNRISFSSWITPY